MPRKNEDYGDHDQYNTQITFRWFKKNHEAVQKVTLHAEDNFGIAKYSCVGHFYRAAANCLLRQEISRLKVKRGRPLKKPMR